MTAFLGILALIASYLLGSLSGGLLLGRLFGQQDLRASGSGNPGATNALRAGGKGYGAAVLIFDLLKGVVAAGVIPLVIVGAGPAWAFLCGAAAVLGHVYPLYYGFRGGKGAATLIGVLLVLLPAALGIAVLVWLAVLVATGFVGLATMLGMITVALWCIITHAAVDAATVFVVAMTLLVFYTHRGNIARMRAGTENRFTRVMLRKPSSHS
ncbi:MAG TPA: glycerol-3-phosphate 1-O-acyltransferase PlsY [Salinisphaeraceae bacterium]|nr:glycerol-3-phosphate 1-O-acyltransferase PlsY [Salinisphaeraceae bacterium]